MPVYANALLGTCGQCERDILLRINPDLVGDFVDETGSVYNDPSGKKTNHSKALWSDEAWTNLLRRWPRDLAALCAVSPKASLEALGRLHYLEHRLSWMRIIMLVAWTGVYGGGRLAVLKIVG